MSDLERHKEALAVATTALVDLEGADNRAYTRRRCKDAFAAIDAVINPPEEFEEVEECAGWATINMHGDGKPVIGGVYLAEDRDKIPDHPDRITVQEIRVKVKRPVKRAVVREVEVESRITEWDDGTGTSGKAISIRNPVRFPFADYPECHGKTGTLIFRWTE